MELAIHFSYLMIILALIVFVCVVFTNAVEHLGEELHLSEGAIGSVLAAVGTALPETIVPLVAILSGFLKGGDVEVGHEIGIGAILGAPFMLGTLAMFVTGVAVYVFTRMGKRTLDMPVNTILIFRDLRYFAFAYLIAVLCSFIPNMMIKHSVALLLIIIYGIYVYQTIKTASKASGLEEDLEELLLARLLKTGKKAFFAMVIIQLLLSLAGIIVLAECFVENIKFIAHVFNINPLILSLIIAPIATELPEKFNSVIWIRAKKDTLSMGNITGAMVFQSCIPTAVGISLTPWVLNIDGLVSVITVYASIGLIYFNIIKNKGVLKPSILILSGGFYLIYLTYIVLKTQQIINI